MVRTLDCSSVCSGLTIPATQCLAQQDDIDTLRALEVDIQHLRGELKQNSKALLFCQVRLNKVDAIRHLGSGECEDPPLQNRIPSTIKLHDAPLNVQRRIPVDGFYDIGDSSISTEDFLPRTLAAELLAADSASLDSSSSSSETLASEPISSRFLLTAGSAAPQLSPIEEMLVAQDVHDHLFLASPTNESSLAMQVLDFDTLTLINNAFLQAPALRSHVSDMVVVFQEWVLKVLQSGSRSYEYIVR